MAIESVETSFRLHDRTAILTGACNTTNQAIAIKLTQMGVNVALVDKEIDRARRFSDQLMDTREVHERFGRATAIQADLAKPNSAQDAITRAAEAFGGLDIYIDGAMEMDVKPFRDPTALKDLEHIIDMNLRSPVMATQAALRFLEARKRGRVIYLMPDLARMGMPQNSLLAMSRTGLSSFARSLAREVAEFNVTVNCVAMGVTEEFLLAQSAGGTSIQEAQSKLAKSFPFAQLTEPEKIANTVAFLASPLGAGITGQTIAVSHGLSTLS